MSDMPTDMSEAKRLVTQLRAEVRALMGQVDYWRAKAETPAFRECRHCGWECRPHTGEQSKKGYPLEQAAQQTYQIPIEGDFFKGVKLNVDPNLPPYTMEIRGSTTVRLNIKTGEIIEQADTPSSVSSDRLDAAQVDPADGGDQ